MPPAPALPGAAMRRKSRILAFGGSALLVVAGVACAFAVATTVGQVVAFVAIASGFVLATSLVFLEVGLSEDRERERDRERQLVHEGERERRRGRTTREGGGPLRPPRLRGQRRRLR